MSLYNKVLIPTDFTMVAWKAVKEGMKLVGNGGTITLLHVYSPRTRFISRDRQGQAQSDKTIESLRRELSEFCNRLETSNHIQIKPELLEGDVDREILKYIKEKSPDIVLMGVNSNTMDNQPGSHLRYIKAHTNVPLMVVENDSIKETA
ncbi:MAG: universal stress protein [Cyclobacteriaceae bacterium]